MGDSETALSETSAVMGYTSGSHTSTGYVEVSSNVAPDTGAPPSEATGGFAASAAPADANSTVPGGSDSGDGNISSTEPNLVMQEAQVDTTFETKPDVGVANTSQKATGLENAATELSPSAGNNSSVNGSVVEAGYLAVENGTASENVGRVADEQQFDGFGMFFLCNFCYISMIWARRL